MDRQSISKKWWLDMGLKITPLDFSRFLSTSLDFLWLPSWLLGSPSELLGSPSELLGSYIAPALDFSRFLSASNFGKY